DVLNGLSDGAGNRAAESGAEDRVEDHIGGEDFGLHGLPGLFIENDDDFATKIAPALEVRGGIAVQFVRAAKQEYADRLDDCFQIACCYKSVAAIVSLSAKHADRTSAKRIRISEALISVADGMASVFHQLKAGNTKALDGDAINLTHLRCGQSFHSRFTPKFTAKSEHPAAADIDDLASDILRLFGSEEGNRGSDIFDSGRAADRKAGVADAACFVQRELVFVDAGGIDDINGDAVFGFFQCERAGQCDDGSLCCSVCRDFGLAKRALGPHRTQVDDAA